MEDCRKIRTQHTLEDLPVLMLSGSTAQGDHVAGFREGANDYVDKPTSERELLARVRMHLDLLLAHRARAEEVKILRGLLPICCHCKNIRDDLGDWSTIETYIQLHSEVDFSHGICPDCLQIHYPELSQP